MNQIQISTKRLLVPLTTVVTLGILVITASLSTGCDTATGADVSKIIMPDSGVSYQNHIRPVLQVTCAYSSCHDQASNAGNIRLSDYIGLTSALAVVIPNNPDASRLVRIIEFDYIHNVNWPANLITDNHRKGIRRWITEGARLN